MNELKKMVRSGEISEKVGERESEREREGVNDLGISCREFRGERK